MVPAQPSVLHLSIKNHNIWMWKWLQEVTLKTHLAQQWPIVEHEAHCNRANKYWWQILPVPNSLKLRHLPSQKWHLCFIAFGGLLGVFWWICYFHFLNTCTVWHSSFHTAASSTFKYPLLEKQSLLVWNQKSIAGCMYDAAILHTREVLHF